MSRKLYIYDKKKNVCNSLSCIRNTTILMHVLIKLPNKITYTSLVNNIYSKGVTIQILLTMLSLMSFHQMLTNLMILMLS